MYFREFHNADRALLYYSRDTRDTRHENCPIYSDDQDFTRLLIPLTSKLSSEIKCLHLDFYFGKTGINKLQKYTKKFSREIYFFHLK